MFQATIIFTFYIGGGYYFGNMCVYHWEKRGPLFTISVDEWFLFKQYYIACEVGSSNKKKKKKLSPVAK